MPNNKIVVPTGYRYWKLVVIKEWAPIGIKNRRQLLVKCDCWIQKEVRLAGLRQWRIKSCWCLWISNLRTHWMTNTLIYKKYKSLCRRCNEVKNQQYKNYWWRGINVEWKTFEEFYKDMWESYLLHRALYWDKNTTIDRIDSDWNYCKENCRWATMKEQQRNRTNNHLYKWKCIAQWCEDLNLHYSNTISRLHNGWSYERALELVN